MKSKQFILLKINIRKKMWELEKLQDLHREETGQDYVMPAFFDLEKAQKSDEAYLESLK